MTLLLLSSLLVLLLCLLLLLFLSLFLLALMLLSCLLLLCLVLLSSCLLTLLLFADFASAARFVLAACVEFSAFAMFGVSDESSVFECVFGIC